MLSNSYPKSVWVFTLFFFLLSCKVRVVQSTQQDSSADHTIPKISGKGDLLEDAEVRNVFIDPDFKTDMDWPDTLKNAETSNALRNLDLRTNLNSPNKVEDAEDINALRDANSKPNLNLPSMLKDVEVMNDLKGANLNTHLNNPNKVENAEILNVLRESDAKTNVNWPDMIKDDEINNALMVTELKTDKYLPNMLKDDEARNVLMDADLKANMNMPGMIEDAEIMNYLRNLNLPNMLTDDETRLNTDLENNLNLPNILNNADKNFNKELVTNMNQPNMLNNAEMRLDTDLTSTQLEDTVNTNCKELKYKWKKNKPQDFKDLHKRLRKRETGHFENNRQMQKGVFSVKKESSADIAIGSSAFHPEGALASIVRNYLSQCSISVLYEQGFESHVLALRRAIPDIPLKIYNVTAETLFSEDLWKMSQCDAFIVLLTSKGPFIQHAATDHYFDTPYNGSKYHPPHYWNYRARFIVVMVPEQDGLLPVDLVRLYNFKKTENLLVLQWSLDHLIVWSNVLYSEDSVIALADVWSDGSFSKGDDLFPDKLNNMQGASIKIATFEHAPSVIYKRGANGQILQRLGVDMGIVAALGQAKNFSIEFTEISALEKWGTKYENGTWDGLMNRVLYEHVDIGICNVFVDHFRWMEVDFSYPYNFMPACFVAPSPKPVVNWQSPILPFAWDTWASIGASLVVVGLLSYLVVLFSVQEEAKEFRNLGYNYLYIIGSFTMHSMYIKPSFPPSRVLLGFLWLSSLIISTGYSANLVAFLSVVRISKPIDTLEELIISGLRIGGHSFWKTQFLDDKDENVRTLIDRLEYDVDFFTVFNEVEKGKFAFMENQEFLQLQQGARFTYGGQASIRLGRQCIINFNIAMILPRNSPLTISFNSDLLHIYESGIMKKWQEEVVVFFRQKYLNKLSKTLSSVRGKPLGLGQLQGVFYFVAIGYIIAFLLLILENIFKP